MNNFMEEIDKRTNLAFSNHMEMLTFDLTDQQKYGINVFKIIEVIETPKTVTKVPKTHPSVIGAVNFRGKLVIVIDISRAIGLQPLPFKETLSYVLVCEYSNSIQGFLVVQPNTLFNVSWEDVKKPVGPLKEAGYLTGLTYDNEVCIQILDVEKVLGEVIGIDVQVSDSVVGEGQDIDFADMTVLVLDDSQAALTMVENALGQLGIPIVTFKEGAQAFAALENSRQQEGETFCLIISDIEMPGMDGFTFTRHVKAHPELSKIHLILHSSMSNEANFAKAKSVGADDFIPKFRPDEIARLVMKHLRIAKTQARCQKTQKTMSPLPA